MGIGIWLRMFHPIFIIPLTTTFWLATRDALRYLWPRAGCPRRRTTSFDRLVRQPRQSFLDHLRISNLERSRLSFSDQETFTGRAILVRFVMSDIFPAACHF